MDPETKPIPFLIAALVLVLVLIGFLVGFWARDSGPFAEDKAEFTVHSAARNDDFTYSLGALAQGHGITIEIHTIENGKVDVLLMDSANHEYYSEGLPFDYIEAGSGLDVANFTTSLEVEHADHYYWVIDNTEQPVGGAQAIGDVSFRGKVKK